LNPSTKLSTIIHLDACISGTTERSSFGIGLAKVRLAYPHVFAVTTDTGNVVTVHRVKTSVATNLDIHVSPFQAERYQASEQAERSEP